MVTSQKLNLGSRATKYLPYALVIYFSLLIFVPWSPFNYHVLSFPEMRVDVAYLMALPELFRRNLQFGPEVVFTYGPLGSLHNSGWIPFNYFFPFMIARSFFAAVFGLAVFEIVRAAPGRRFVRWLVGLLFILFSVCTGEWFQIYFCSFGLFALVFHFLIERDRQYPSALLCILTVACALVSLIKFSVATATIVQFVAIGLSYFWREKRIPILPFLYFSSMVLFWMAVGQKAANLPHWFSACFDLAMGYSDAMAKGFSVPYSGAEIRWFYAALAGLMLVLLRFQDQNAFRNKAHFWLFAGGISFFLVFENQHAWGGNQIEQSAVGIIFIVVLFISIIRFGSLRAPAKVAAIALLLLSTCVQVGIIRKSPIVSSMLTTPLQFSYLWDRAKQMGRVLSGRLEEHRKGYDGLLKSSREAANLPAGLSGTADVYPDDSGVVTSYPGLIYQPRPAFLSLNAHSTRLALANADFLKTKAAPKTILFEIVPPLERNLPRYPSTVDGPSWKEMVSYYRLTQRTPNFLIFSRRASPLGYSLISLGRRKVHWGEDVTVSSNAGAPLWIQMDIKRSFLGQLVHAAFKLPRIDIRITEVSGAVSTFQIIPDLGRAGFLLSPFVNDNESFAAFAQSPNHPPKALETHAISSFRLQLEGDLETFFSRDIEINLSELKFDQ